MAKIVVKNISPYDGEYDLDTDRAFNSHEWRWIKQVSGYMPLTVGDGFEGGDPDLFVALAVIALVRAGRIERKDVLSVADTLAEAPFDGAAITMIGDEVEDDSPLALTSEPDASSRTNSLEKQSSSGEDSRNVLVSRDEILPPTTLLRSGTS